MNLKEGKRARQTDRQTEITESMKTDSWRQ